MIVNDYRIGVFANLTNSYSLVSVGASENFYRLVIGRHKKIKMAGSLLNLGRRLTIM